MERYQLFKYNNFIKRIVFIAILPFIYILLYIFLGNENSNVLANVLLPITIGAVLIVCMLVARRIVLNTLIVTDLNAALVYELDKRKESPKNHKHNLSLLLNVAFYNGDFRKTIELGNDFVADCGNPAMLEAIRHKIIMAYFLLGDFNNAAELIKTQKSQPVKNILLTNFYDYIDAFINENYQEAINIINRILETKKPLVFNNMQILAYYCQKIVYDKTGDETASRMCAERINERDMQHNTFFSQNQ